MLGNLKHIFTANPESKNTKIIHIILLTLVTTVVYLNIFQNTFILDDRQIFFNWPAVADMNFNALIKGNYPANFNNEPAYRPLKSIIHSVDYKIFSNSAVFYHLQAILVQIAIVILIYLITKQLTKKATLALVTAALFAVHPTHTEAVTFMTASFDTIGILFFFGSFYLYLKSRIEAKNSKIYFIFSLILAICAVFTYELTLTLPFIILLYEICFNNLRLNNLKKNLHIYLPYFAILLFFLIIRAYFMQEVSPTPYFANSMYFTFLTMLKAFLVYLLLFLFPLNLSMLQALPGGIATNFNQNIIENSIKISQQSILEPSILISILLIFVLILSFFRYLKKEPLISFCIGFMFIAFLPVSNILPVRQIMAIRYAYIASFGVILAFSYLFLNFYGSEELKPRKFIKKIMILFLLFIIFAFSLRTILTNTDYKDEVTMLKTWATQDVGGYAANYYLGKYYFYKTDYKTASYYLKRVTDLGEEKAYEDLDYYLSLSYVRQGKVSLAKQTYQRLVGLYPAYDPESLNLLHKIIYNPKTLASKTQVSKTSSVYESADNFSFSHPINWRVEQNDKGDTVLSPNGDFVINLNYSVLVGSTTIIDYLKNEKLTSYGKLKQEGRANIPTVEFAYVKIWEDNGVSKAQFFLFKGKNVLEVVASPFDAGNIDNLNLILNSVKFTN